MNIYVLIPTHGRPTLLGRTLDSLAECELPEGYVETVVVENGVKAGAEIVVQETAIAHPHLHLRYMHVERANKSHALNEALETIDDGLVVFLDDDVRFGESLLITYSRAASARGRGFFFGGPTLSDFEKKPPDWRLNTMPVSVRGWSPREGEDIFFLGFNWAAWRSDLYRVGGFDVERGPGSSSGSTGQESDMQRCLKAMGVNPYYIPEAQVWHYVPKVRSSVRWAMKRSYRSGVEKGLNAALGLGEKSVGASFWPRLIFRTTAGIAVNVARLNRSGLWQSISELYRSVGYAKGLRRARE